MIFCLILINKCLSYSICIGTSNEQCKETYADKFYEIKDFDPDELNSGSTLYVYGDASSVKISFVNAPLEFEIIGISGKDNIEPIITFDIGNINAINTIKLRNIVIISVSEIVSCVKMDMNNVIFKKGNQISKCVLDSTFTVSDSKSLIYFDSITSANFILTSIDKDITSDITINIEHFQTTYLTPTFFIGPRITISKDIKENAEIILSAYSFSIKPYNGNNKISFKTKYSFTKVYFKDITSKYTFIQKEKFGFHESFLFDLKLNGGIVSFPNDFQKSLSFGMPSNKVLGPIFNIIQKEKSTIEIGGLNVPALIANIGSAGINIITTSRECGITNSLILKSSSNSINSQITEPIIFYANEVKNLELNSDLNSNNQLTLMVSYLDIPISSSKNVKTKSMNINILSNKNKESNYFDLISGGTITLEIKIEKTGKIILPNINYKAEIPYDSHNLKYNLNINLNMDKSIHFEELKKKINIPLNLMCANKIPQNAFNYNFINEDADEFKEITEFKIEHINNQDCIQMIMKSLPASIPEKYCYGSKCNVNNNDYVPVKLTEITNPKSIIHKGTKKINFLFNESLKDSIKLSELPNINTEISITSLIKNELTIDIDQTDIQHIKKLRIENCSLDINFKNIISNKDIEMKIPYVELINNTIKGKLYEDNVLFLGKEVFLDFKTFGSLTKSVYNNLGLQSTYPMSIQFNDNDINIGTNLIKKEKHKGIIEYQILTDSLNNNEVTLSQNSVKFDGFILNTQALNKELTLNFKGNWENSKFTKPLIIKGNNLKFVDITNNIKLSLNEVNDASFSFKYDNINYLLNDPITINCNNEKFSYRANNGIIKYTEINFIKCNNIESSFMENSKINNKLITNNINVMESDEIIFGDLIIGKKLSLKNTKTLKSNYIDIKNGIVEINYSFGSFPLILTRNGMTTPKEIILRYEGKDKITDDLLNSISFVYCAKRKIFSIQNCNSYKKLVTFKSDNPELNGKNSRIKPFCTSYFLKDESELQNCLGVMITDAQPNEPEVPDEPDVPQEPDEPGKKTEEPENPPKTDKSSNITSQITNNKKDHSKFSRVGLIVGIIAALAGISAITGGIIFYIKMKNGNNSNEFIDTSL